MPPPLRGKTAFSHFLQFALFATRSVIIVVMRRDYDMRRRFTVHAFREIGLPCFEPEGAFYLFPCIQSTGLSSEEFCERLIYSKRVAVVPGNAFGDCGEGFIRVSYCYSIENIKEAVTRIGEFVKELEDEHDR